MNTDTIAVPVIVRGAGTGSRGRCGLLEHFDLVVPSLPGYGFSPRPPRVGINYQYVSDRWHRLMSELGYSRYGASGDAFGAAVTTILALDHPKSVIGVHLTTLESDLTPVVGRYGTVRC
jgi:pimeloyl-ACP methyl ester carboxylesterase